MRSIRKSGITALTAAIALSLGAVPVALTVAVDRGLAIDGNDHVTASDASDRLVGLGGLELATRSEHSATAKSFAGSGRWPTASRRSRPPTDSC